MKDGQPDNKQRTYRRKRAVLMVTSVLGTLILQLTPLPAEALLSGSTGSIHGRPPTATGELGFWLYNPYDSEYTTINPGSYLTGRVIPAGVTTVATSSLNPGTVVDEDGDCDNTPITAPCANWFDQNQLTWTWKYNGEPLSQTDLSKQLTQYTGSTLTIEGKVPWLLVTSPTGMPHVWYHELSASSFNVQVRPPVVTYGYPGGGTNYYQLPSTGFTGAYFLIALDASYDTAGYTWTANKSWISIMDGRNVVFGNMPEKGDGAYTLTGTHNRDGATITLHGNVKQWYGVSRINQRHTGAHRQCLADGWDRVANSLYLESDWGGGLAVYGSTFSDGQEYYMARMYMKDSAEAEAAGIVWPTYFRQKIWSAFDTTRVKIGTTSSTVTGTEYRYYHVIDTVDGSIGYMPGGASSPYLHAICVSDI